MDIFTLKFKNSNQPQSRDILTALEEDLRIDLNELKLQLNKNLLTEMQPHYLHRRWNKLVIKFLLENL